MANRIADSSKYPTKAAASGAELVHTNDSAGTPGAPDQLLTSKTIADLARLIPVREITITAGVITAADSGGAIHGNNAAAITLTIQPDSTLNLPIGFNSLVRQFGAGAVSVVAGSGVTLRNGRPTAKTAGQYNGSISLHKVAANTWYLDGNTAAS